MAVGMVITVPAVFSFASIVMMLIDIGLALADSERLIDPRLGRDGALCRIGYGLPHELNGLDRKIVWFHVHRGAALLTHSVAMSGIATPDTHSTQETQFRHRYASNTTRPDKHHK